MNYPLQTFPSGFVSLLCIHPRVLNLDQPLQNFCRAISVRDWSRFDVYSWRVRKLTFKLPWKPSVFEEIGLTRPRLELLPNLTTLTLGSGYGGRDLLFIVLFGHSSVRSLTLSGSPASSLSETFGAPLRHSKLRYISTRMPKLRVLSVNFTHQEFYGVPERYLPGPDAAFGICSGPRLSRDAQDSRFLVNGHSHQLPCIPSPTPMY